MSPARMESWNRDEVATMLLFFEHEKAYDDMNDMMASVDDAVLLTCYLQATV